MDNKKTFLPIIIKKNNLSDVEENILNFINSLELETFNMTTSELAKRVFCSEASISRFIKKYNFSNYRYFVIYVNNKIEEFKIQQKSFLGIEKELNPLKNIHNYAIENAVNSQNIDKIHEAAEIISKSKKIMCLGMGSSNKFANEFASNLTKAGLNVYHNTDFHALMPIIGLLNENDCAIIISNNLINHEIIFSIKEIKKQNAKIITITSNSENLLINYIDCKIIYTKIHDTNKKVPIASKLSAIIIIDYIFEILTSFKKEYRNNIEKTNIILEKWRKSK